jgi:head-tail adaptor
MSLLDEAMEKCIYLDKTTAPDGYGGTTISWQEGAEFYAAIVFDTSMEARVADKQGVTSLYTITTRKNLTLEYHDVFRRLRDGKIFRVTSDGDDKHTPASANLDMRQVTAEEWSLPNG